MPKVDSRFRGVMDATRRAAEAVGRFVVESLERSGPICGMYHCEWIPDGCYPITVDPTFSGPVEGDGATSQSPGRIHRVDPVALP